MSTWTNIRLFLSGGASRNKGIQSGNPSSSTNAPATPVTVDTALQLSAVWACTRIITEAIGSLPIIIYDIKEDGTLERNTDHPLARLFSGKVNRWQTRQEYIESLVYQTVLQGNDYSFIDRNGIGDVISLTPFMTAQMAVDLQDSGDISYEYTQDSGTRKFASKSIWHNKLFGNGIIGLSPLAHARNSVGIGQGAEKAVGNIYTNGGKPSGILTVDKVLKPDQRAAIKNSFSEMSNGNNDRLFVLEADFKYTQASLSPNDIELLASRRFQIEDVCRFFGVPSILANDSQAGTTWGSGIQQIVQGFYKFGLKPYLTRYQSSMEANLLTPLERGKIAIRFDVSELLEPSKADRIKSGKEGVTGGLFTPNEWRKTEGLPPIDGGDKVIVQQQMVPIDTIQTPISE